MTEREYYDFEKNMVRQIRFDRAIQDWLREKILSRTGGGYRIYKHPYCLEIFIRRNTPRMDDTYRIRVNFPENIHHDYLSELNYESNLREVKDLICAALIEEFDKEAVHCRNEVTAAYKNGYERGLESGRRDRMRTEKLNNPDGWWNS